ncbi:MAG: hypothetical protein J6B71_05835, partial [Clostridia bacterium]|nr:hypothetical protein [Clostridia bacterium]
SEIRFKLFRFVLLSCCSIFKDHFSQPLSRADLSIIPHLIRFVNTFFKSFSGFFKKFCSQLVRCGLSLPSALAVSLYIILQIKSFVKHFFQKNLYFFLFVQNYHLLQISSPKTGKKSIKATHSKSNASYRRFFAPYQKELAKS